jgi:signal recognition particle subunit SEC65
MASQLKACPTGLCVPDKFIETGGNFIPPTCRSVNNAEGRCLHVEIPQVAAQKGLLPQATCQTYERCVPCYNPTDGKETGSCKLSCDPGPKEPAKTFAECCKDNNPSAGRCVPKTAIEDKLEKNLDQDTCAEGAELCVPNDFLNPAYKPQACSASSLILGQYTGVCLSDCLKFGIQGIALARGNCPSDYKCAPCTRNGQPTGAPGCPP